MEQDWTQNFKRNGTFVLDDNEMSNSSTPATIRAATPLKQGTVTINRPMSRSKIPSATSGHRRSMESSMINGSNNSSSMSASMMSMSMTSSITNSDDMMLAVRQLEDTISPLARANNQIRDSLAQLEKSLITLKAAASVSESTNSD